MKIVKGILGRINLILENTPETGQMNNSIKKTQHKRNSTP